MGPHGTRCSPRAPHAARVGQGTGEPVEAARCKNSPPQTPVQHWGALCGAGTAPVLWGWTAEQPPACGKTLTTSCDFSLSPSRCFSTNHRLPRESQLSSAQPVPVQRASIFPAAGNAGKNNHVHKTRLLSRASGPAEILWPAAPLTTAWRTAPGAGLAWGTAAPRASAPATTCHSAVDVPGLALAPPRQLKGTYPRGQRRGMVMKRCCCETAGPWARRSGGLRHSSAEATRESQCWARGDAEPDTRLSERSQSREGQSQKQLVKRAQKHLMLVARQSRAV